MNIDQKVIYNCTICDTDFRKRIALERHIKNMHDAYSQTEKGIKRKKECNPTLNDADLKNIIVERSNKYKGNVKVAVLKNMIEGGSTEYLRKVKLGRKIKSIMKEIKAPRACLDEDQMEALTSFEKHELFKKIKHPTKGKKKESRS